MAGSMLAGVECARRRSFHQEHFDCNLGGVARQAKDRLEERLRSLSNTTGRKNKEWCDGSDRQPELLGDLQTVVFGLKKIGRSKRFNWAKLKWRAPDQDECAVCLESYKGGETLTRAEVWCVLWALAHNKIWTFLYEIGLSPVTKTKRMAGMLAGVECARRRSFHQSGSSSDSSWLNDSNSHHAWLRRPYFCFYTSSSTRMLHIQHEKNVPPNPLMNQEQFDCYLGGVARRAKDRLNQRLRSLSNTTRRNNKERYDNSDRQPEILEDLQTVVFGLNKIGGSKRFDWAKLKWRASHQDECVACLESYKGGETLARAEVCSVCYVL